MATAESRQPPSGGRELKRTATLPLPRETRCFQIACHSGERGPACGTVERLNQSLKVHTMRLIGFQTCRRLALILALTLSCGAAAHAADEKQPLPPQDAQKHVGEEITVEMQVKAAKKSAKMKKVFLDSSENFQDADNLGISIDEKGEKELSTKFANTDLPAYFLKKTIRVKGTVVRRDDRTYIDVSLGSQVDLPPKQTE